MISPKAKWAQQLLEATSDRKVLGIVKKQGQDPIFAAYSDGGWVSDLLRGTEYQKIQSWNWPKELKAVVPERNLNFKDTRKMTPKQWTMAMDKAIGGYNNFDAKKVGKVFQSFPGIKIQAARESSVAAYASNFKDWIELKNFLEMVEKKTGVDELSIENGLAKQWGGGAKAIIKGADRWVQDMLSSLSSDDPDFNEKLETQARQALKQLDVLAQKAEVRMWWD